MLVHRKRILVTSQLNFPTVILHPHRVFLQFVCASDPPALTACLSLAAYKPVPKALEVILFCDVCAKGSKSFTPCPLSYISMLFLIYYHLRQTFTLFVSRSLFDAPGFSTWNNLTMTFINRPVYYWTPPTKTHHTLKNPHWMRLFLYPSANTEQNFRPDDLCRFPQTKPSGR